MCHIGTEFCQGGTINTPSGEIHLYHSPGLLLSHREKITEFHSVNSIIVVKFQLKKLKSQR